MIETQYSSRGTGFFEERSGSQALLLIKVGKLTGGYELALYDRGMVSHLTLLEAISINTLKLLFGVLTINFLY